MKANNQNGMTSTANFILLNLIKKAKLVSNTSDFIRFSIKLNGFEVDFYAYESNDYLPELNAFGKDEEIEPNDEQINLMQQRINDAVSELKSNEKYIDNSSCYDEKYNITNPM